MTTQDILAGFHGSLDIHGHAKNDVEDILKFAEEHGITDPDDARREYCASLSDDEKCAHA